MNQIKSKNLMPKIGIIFLIIFFISLGFYDISFTPKNPLPNQPGGMSVGQIYVVFPIILLVIIFLFASFEINPKICWMVSLLCMLGLLGFFLFIMSANLQYLPVAPLHSVAIWVIWLVSLPALVLLFMKKKVGFYLAVISSFLPLTIASGFLMSVGPIDLQMLAMESLPILTFLSITISMLFFILGSKEIFEG